jgi:hypothetical protein
VTRLDPDADPSPRGEVPDDDGAPGSDGRDDIGQDPVGDRLGEDGLVPVGTEVVLQGLALDAAAVGRVADGDLGIIRLAGHGAEGGELLREKGHLVVARRGAFETLQHGLIGGIDFRERAAAEQREGVVGFLGAVCSGHEGDRFAAAGRRQARSAAPCPCPAGHSQIPRLHLNQKVLYGADRGNRTLLWPFLRLRAFA